MTSYARPLLIAACWLAFAADGRAAGGHFEVDDAAVAESGHCQHETWLTRAPAASATLFHLGSGCRVGSVELGFNYDRLSTAVDTRGALGPQLKWVADPLVGPLSAGIAWSAARDLKRGGRLAHTLYVPLTWAMDDKVAVNANLGADWDSAGARTRRMGVSGEWIAREKLTVIGERVKLAGDWTSRLGTRFRLSDAISVDLSAARVGARATRVCVIGLNHDFAR
jgi:hypothetical protein